MRFSSIEQPTDLSYLSTLLLSVSRSTTKTSPTEVSAVLNNNKEGTTLRPADNLVMVDSRDMVDNRGTAGTPSNRGMERLLLSSTEGVGMGDLLRGILSSNSPYVMFYVSSGAQTSPMESRTIANLILLLHECIIGLRPTPSS